MLIEMRETGLADLLIDTAYCECDVDGDHRRLMPFDHEDGQSVRELVFNHSFGKAR